MQHNTVFQYSKLNFGNFVDQVHYRLSSGFTDFLFLLAVSKVNWEKKEQWKIAVDQGCRFFWNEVILNYISMKPG